jgi:3'-5' exonuclease
VPIKALRKFQPNRLLIFDIETASEYPTLADAPETTQKAWANLGINFGKAPDEIAFSYTDKSALMPEFSKVIAFSAGRIVKNGSFSIKLIKSFSGSDEAILLGSISDFLQEVAESTWEAILAGAAIIGYDIPFLARRYMANNLDVPEALDLSDCKPWEVGAFDLINIWKGTSFKPSALDSICHCLGVESSKIGDVKGSSVGDVYHNASSPLDARLHRISGYCDRDVVATGESIIKMYRLNKGG